MQGYHENILTVCNRKLHTSPDNALEHNIRHVEEIRKSKGFKVWREVVRHLCQTDPWFLSKYVMGYWFLDENLHGKELLQFTSDHWQEDQMKILPRGHVKTYSSCVDIVQLILNKPLIGILAASATDDLIVGINRIVANTLLHNTILQEAFGDILPKKKSECEMWGKEGFTLPCKSKDPRLEPTFKVSSVSSNATGFHPDVLFADDLTGKENNNEAGNTRVEAFLEEAKMQLMPWGTIRWNLTRWSDADPAGKALDGDILGKQGRFVAIVKSCFIDDDPKKDCIFPKRIPKRWDSKKQKMVDCETPTGEDKDKLLDQMKQKDRKKRWFFGCQKRNNPMPEEDTIIKVDDIVIYDDKTWEEKCPEFGRVLAVGIEVTGGGLPIYNVIDEMNNELRIGMPLEQITNPRKAGVSKADRMIAALEPYSRMGKIRTKSWMMKKNSDDNLMGELRRLGVGKHDDIVDALHNIPVHLAKDGKPKEGHPAHLYISVDLAWSEEKRSDFTVILSGLVDSQGNIWVLNYERFQTTQPSVVGNRLISFYIKINESSRKFHSKRKPNSPLAMSYV